MEPRTTPAPPWRFLRGLLAWALFAAPIVYFGMSAAVLVHEVLGHGVTSLLTGGEFRGFELDFQGGGHASTDSPDAAARAWVLAGGVLWEAATGVLLLLLATRVRPLHWRVFLLIVAANFLHDALPYAFWDAVWLGGSGDASRLLALGVKQDDILVVQLPNIAELVVTYLAAWQVGAVVSPVAIQFREHELGHILKLLRPRAFVTCADFKGFDAAELASTLCGDLDCDVLVWGERVAAAHVSLDRELAGAASVPLEELRLMMPISLRGSGDGPAGNQWAPVRFRVPATIDEIGRASCRERV